MNERIKELAEQVYGSAATAQEIKFAELIVRECASICEINGQSYKYSFTPAKARLAESTSNHCAMMINKHFGVKE
jgi:hypothetical protein